MDLSDDKREFVDIARDRIREHSRHRRDAGHFDKLSDNATVYCSNFVRQADGWTIFPTLERYTADELYPHQTDHPTWE